MFEGITESYYGILNTLFAPIISINPTLSIIILASIVIFIITLFYKFLINQEAIKEIKAQIKEYQAKIKKVQKEEPEKSKEVMAEMMKLTNKQMKMSFKPMIPTLIIVMLILPWMATVFTGPVIKVPFHWPLSGTEYFGWLIWYIVLSIPMTQIFRKILGVEM